jgi:hypothetical protein
MVLSCKIDRYVDKLVGFDGLDWRDSQIESHEIEGRVLDIVIPVRSGTPTQINAIAQSTGRARRLGIHILINRY